MPWHISFSGLFYFFPKKAKTWRETKGNSLLSLVLSYKSFYCIKLVRFTIKETSTCKAGCVFKKLWKIIVKFKIFRNLKLSNYHYVCNILHIECFFRNSVKQIIMKPISYSFENFLKNIFKWAFCEYALRGLTVRNTYFSYSIKHVSFLHLVINYNCKKFL
jgi:hypothetical protein